MLRLPLIGGAGGSKLETSLLAESLVASRRSAAPANVHTRTRCIMYTPRQFLSIPFLRDISIDHHLTRDRGKGRYPWLQPLKIRSSRRDDANHALLAAVRQRVPHIT